MGLLGDGPKLNYQRQVDNVDVIVRKIGHFFVWKGKDQAVYSDGLGN